MCTLIHSSIIVLCWNLSPPLPAVTVLSRIQYGLSQCSGDINIPPTHCKQIPISVAMETGKQKKLKQMISCLSGSVTVFFLVHKIFIINMIHVVFQQKLFTVLFLLYNNTFEGKKSTVVATFKIFT